MKNLTIENIVAAILGDWHGNAALLEKEVSFITTDSRNVEENCLFAAIKGENSDGHDYIGTSIEKGALCVIAERLPAGDALPVIVVKNTVEALGDLAAFYRRQFDIPVLGITGSVGKTTAKEMVSVVLSRRFNVHKTPKNLNNELGVPLTLFGLDESMQFAVIEMGISHFGEMRRLAEIVRPDMALYTTIGSAHLEFLGDFEGVLKAKSEMLDYLPEDGVVFVNGDNETLQKLTCKQEICRYGVSRGCDVSAENISLLGTDGMELDIVSGTRRIPAKINSFGVHMVTAALGAAAIGLYMGLTDAEISAGIADYVPVGSRSGIIKTDKITIIDDCYNANPTSVAAAIDSLAMLRGRRVCVLGDMGELGETAAELHFETGTHAVNKGINLVITCGELSANTAEGAKSAGCTNVVHFKDKAELIYELPKLIENGDAVLVKASHGKKFEEIVESLKNLK